MKEPHVRPIALDDLVVSPARARRPLDPAYLDELAASIRELGVLQPVVVSTDNVLIAGYHRVAACRKLGIGAILAHVRPLADLRAELAAIDENLVRRDGTAAWRARELARRKEIWLALHPQTKRGGAPGAGRGHGKRPRLEDGHGGGLPKRRAFAEETAAATGRSRRTVERHVSIAERIAPDLLERLDQTPVADKPTELEKIARLEPREQRRVAAELAAGAGTVRLAQNRLSAARIAAEPPPLPRGPFHVIAADPPWPYQKRTGDASQRGQRPYPDMTLDQIRALPVADLALQDCVLWLWTTNAHLEPAFTVVRAWGFVPRTVLTWDKERMGLGDWLRGQTEHVIMAVRGRPTVTLTNQTTLIRERPREHSRKPEAFYALVESLCPGSKVELFARAARPGWQAWGAESELFTAA
jgi:N6-adenosine-specific RNA methylase IME4/ParB-like chromosome segregation protein Spo0J